MGVISVINFGGPQQNQVCRFGQSHTSLHSWLLRGVAASAHAGPSDSKLDPGCTAVSISQASETLGCQLPCEMYSSLLWHRPSQPRLLCQCRCTQPFGGAQGCSWMSHPKLRPANRSLGSEETYLKYVDTDVYIILICIYIYMYVHTYRYRSKYRYRCATSKSKTRHIV